MKLINQRAKERELILRNQKYSNILEKKYNNRPDSKASVASSASPKRLHSGHRRPSSRDLQDDKLKNIL